MKTDEQRIEDLELIVSIQRRNIKNIIAENLKICNENSALKCEIRELQKRIKEYLTGDEKNDKNSVTKTIGRKRKGEKIDSPKKEKEKSCKKESCKKENCCQEKTGSKKSCCKEGEKNVG